MDLNQYHREQPNRAINASGQYLRAREVALALFKELKRKAEESGCYYKVIIADTGTSYHSLNRDPLGIEPALLNIRVSDHDCNPHRGCGGSEFYADLRPGDDLPEIQI